MTHESICLELDTLVSRKHARILARPDAVEIEDLGSKNGTFVNGIQVHRQRLQDGDIVRIGGTLLLLRAEPAREPAAQSVPFVAESIAMRVLLAEIEVLAPQDQTILLLGETGSGKEVIARHIHACSRRADPLVAVNCAAIPSELAESLLFGHKRGAFSGAVQEQEGFFRSARGGTLFLDEIGELPLPLQAKLLRALELHEVTPIGSTLPVHFQARIIAATNRDLRAVQGDRFRTDLFARLCGAVLDVPPLRERREDILPLLRSVLRSNVPLSTRLAEALLLHPWPLNAREIVSIGEYLRTRFPAAECLDLDHAQARLRMTAPPPTDSPAPLPSGSALARVQTEPLALAASAEREPERAQLMQLLTEHRGNLARVAAALDLSPRQVRRRMEQLGIHRKNFLPDR